MSVFFVAVEFVGPVVCVCAFVVVVVALALNNCMYPTASPANVFSVLILLGRGT